MANNNDNDAVVIVAASANDGQPKKQRFIRPLPLSLKTQSTAETLALNEFRTQRAQLFDVRTALLSYRGILMQEETFLNATLQGSILTAPREYVFELGNPTDRSEPSIFAPNTTNNVDVVNNLETNSNSIQNINNSNNNNNGQIYRSTSTQSISSMSSEPDPSKKRKRDATTPSSEFDQQQMEMVEKILQAKLDGVVSEKVQTEVSEETEAMLDRFLQQPDEEEEEDTSAATPWTVGTPRTSTPKTSATSRTGMGTPRTGMGTPRTGMGTPRTGMGTPASQSSKKRK